MNSVSADNRRSWTVTDNHSAALEIALLKRTVVLAWTQFIYAEGGDDEVHLAFASHDVIIRGAGLTTLLADIRTQRLATITEPLRSDRFPAFAARGIREVVVRSIETND
jgi:hypothetical protein